jgi:hypothetical protein
VFGWGVMLILISIGDGGTAAALKLPCCSDAGWTPEELAALEQVVELYPPGQFSWKQRHAAFSAPLSRSFGVMYSTLQCWYARAGAQAA